MPDVPHALPHTLDQSIARQTELAFRLRRTAAAFHRALDHPGPSFITCRHVVCQAAHATLHRQVPPEQRCDCCPHKPARIA